MIEVLHVLFCSIPSLALELGVEIYRAKVLKRRDVHALTAAIRGIVTAWGALTYDAVPWYLSAGLMLSVHYLIFNYYFNRYGINAHWSYLGGNFWDRLQKRVHPLALLAIKVGLVVLFTTLIAIKWKL